MQPLYIFIINSDFILKFQYGEIHLTAILELDIYQRDAFKNDFLSKQRKSLENTRKRILFLSKIHPKHRKHILTAIPNVNESTITSNKQKLILLIWNRCFTSCIIKGHMERTINLQSKLSGFHIIHKNKKIKN